MIEGARKASGTAVLIDVFRAFTVCCYVFNQGADRILPVAGVDEALALKRRHPEWILIGERGGRKVEGFDYGNSPSQLATEGMSGRTVVQTTSAGTQGLVAAIGAQEALAAALVNARATAEYLRARSPEMVSLVAMGNGGVHRAEEDVICAEYIRAILVGNEYALNRRLRRLRRTETRFFNPSTQDSAPAADFDLCTDVDRFDMVMRMTDGAEGRLALHTY